MKDLPTLPFPLRAERLKKLASEAVRSQPETMTHMQALDIIAKDLGFTNWAEFVFKKGVK